MDWLPTLLELAGGRPDPDYPSDCMSLVPTLTRNAVPAPRKLYWRFRFNSQRALREGDMKWLRIRDKAFLFNVVEDPLERANLKDRRPEVYSRLAGDFDAWNATMLPEDPASTSATFYDDQLADHYGNKRKTTE